TKPVTSVAIMMMIEEGKVHLNDPVSRYIPEFKNLTVAVASTDPAPAGAGAAKGKGKGRSCRLHPSPRPDEFGIPTRHSLGL
ncbi:MAG: serine hydrolase, partial [Acidobacteriota bacterium]